MINCMTSNFMDMKNKHSEDMEMFKSGLKAIAKHEGLSLSTKFVEMNKLEEQYLRGEIKLFDIQNVIDSVICSKCGSSKTYTSIANNKVCLMCWHTEANNER